ncbi:MAG: 30S ribosomal protein S8 [bacterium]|nr:30S ribosomal protein S8 [bacterium]
MMTDPIADMLTRIRNASMVRKPEVVLPFSKIKLAIALVLVRAGYLLGAEEKTEGSRQYLVLGLRYEDGQSVIHTLNRVSKPGHRRYIKAAEMKPVLNGYGLAVLSTPQGIMTNKEAKKAKVGGEIICEIY